MTKRTEKGEAAKEAKPHEGYGKADCVRVWPSISAVTAQRLRKLTGSIGF